MFDNSIMPFGTYKGKMFKDVPDEYLLYLWNNQENKKLFGELKEYIKDNLDTIEYNCRTNI